MATNAHGIDYWVGRVFRSKDQREDWRHVVITDIRHGRAKCHNLIYGEPRKMSNRGTWISLKGLASRWKNCEIKDCYCKQIVQS